MRYDLIGVHITTFDEIIKEISIEMSLKGFFKTATVVRKVIEETVIRKVLGVAVIECAHFLKHTVQDQGLYRLHRIHTVEPRFIRLVGIWVVGIRVNLDTGIREKISRICYRLVRLVNMVLKK